MNEIEFMIAVNKQLKDKMLRQQYLHFRVELVCIHFCRSGPPDEVLFRLLRYEVVHCNLKQQLQTKHDLVTFLYQ